MYNRYLPQNDGTHRRRAVEEPAPERQKQPVRPEQPHNFVAKDPPCRNDPIGFLHQLLPAGFDTSDLIIVLLLLLIAGDCEEEKNNALLTVALYFIL